MQYDFEAVCRLLEAVWTQAYRDAAQGRTSAEYFLDCTNPAWRRRPLPPKQRRGYRRVMRQNAMGRIANGLG